MIIERDSLLEQHESNMLKLIERIYFIHYALSIVVAVLSFNRTAYEKTTETIIVTTYIVLSVSSLLVLLLTKKFIQKKETKLVIFLLLNTSFFWVMNFLEMDKFFVTLTTTVCVFFFLIFFTQKIKYVLFFSISPMVIVLYRILLSPYHEIRVGQSFYILVLFTFILMVYLSIEGIKLYNWYVTQLTDRVKLTSEQNQELLALNEEYIASEEVLKEQYDELETLHKSIRLALKKMDILFDITNDGLIEVNLLTNKVTFNKMSETLFHLGDTLIRTVDQLSHYLSEEDFRRIEHAYSGVENNNVSVAQEEISFIYGQSISHYRLTITKYTEQELDYIIIAVKNITFEKDHEAYLNELAYYDTLTRVPNKLALLSYLDNLIISNKTEYYISIVDIQDMKNINHMFGFSVGDDLIKSVANSLCNLYDEECFVARTGGDEFTIVCSNNHILLNTIARVERAFNSIVNDFIKYKIRFNMGIAYFVDDKTSMNWFENAEIAMYQAKENIMNHYSVYDQNFRHIAEKRLLISYELEKALYGNELFLNFQPEVRIENEKIIAFEALIRWHSPTLGVVSPSDFIPIAEKTGFILELGDFIIHESCKFAKEAIKRSREIIVSINISGVQLLDDKFEHNFLTIIDSYHIPRSNIAIEVTETSIIENLNQAKVILTNLKKEGIHIFLDDFGTGYSSLLYLNLLPIDVLKIDKSFIDELCVFEKNKKLVEAMILLSRDMNIKVIAEGVESEDQIQILRACKCDIVQGYYYYKPLSFDEALSLA